MILNLVDFDGTLFLTNDALYDAYNTACKTFGYEIPREIWENSQGENIESILIKCFGKLTPRLVSGIREHKYNNYPKDYLDRILQNYVLLERLAKPKNINVVCTNTTQCVVESLLRHSCKEAIFNGIISREMVDNPKPCSDIFDKAFKLFYNEKVMEINIFEDSDVGIVAAQQFANNIKIPIKIYKVEDFNAMNLTEVV